MISSSISKQANDKKQINKQRIRTASPFLQVAFGLKKLAIRD
jgi:hypothetical protein